jgi:hypothetical protein
VGIHGHLADVLPNDGSCSSDVQYGIAVIEAFKSYLTECVQKEEHALQNLGVFTDWASLSV